MSQLHPDAAIHRAATRAARSVHGRARTVAQSHAKNVEVGTIFQVVPTIMVEPASAAYKLEEGKQLRLSDQVRWWDANYGLIKGDLVAMVEIADHSWVVFAVLTDRSVVAGVKGRRPPVAGFGKGAAFTDPESSAETGVLSATVDLPARSVSVSGGGTDSGGDTISFTSTGTQPAQTNVAVTLTWGKHIIRKLRVYDDDGTLIGYVPVFDALA